MSQTVVEVIRMWMMTLWLVSKIWLMEKASTVTRNKKLSSSQKAF